MARIFLVLAACLLASSCVAKQSQEAAPLIWNNAGHGSSSPPPLKLDPVLRRALLRALTQLELEAQRKAAGADATENTYTADYPNDSQEENIKRDLEELLGNYENTIKPSEEQRSSFADKKNQDMIVLDEQSSQPADDVSVIDYEVPGDKTKSPDDLNHQETTSFLDNRQESAIFCQDQQNESEKKTGVEEKKSETDNPPQIDIQSNVIPTATDKAHDSEKRGNEQDSNAIETSLTGNNAVVRSKELGNDNGGGKLNVDDQDVSIFQAPLVAAFTLQQDEKGNPKSVVPLLRRPQSSLTTQQQQRLQQQSLQQQQFHLSNPPQSFPTLPIDQQHRFQLQTLHPAGQQPLFQPQSLPPTEQQLRFQGQPFQITREQELERQRRLLEQQLLQLQQQQRFQQQQQFHQQELLKQQQHIEQERLRQRQQLFLEEQQRLRLQQQSFLPLEPPPQPQHQRPQRQETGTSIVDFQQSVGFQFRQPNNLFQQQFVPPTFHQGFNPSTDFLRNNANSFRQPSQPSSVNSQLQNLLYLSGVAGDLQINGASPQEDLNIVSKILSLNHEGRETRASRETIQTPSSFISPPLP